MAPKLSYPLIGAVALALTLGGCSVDEVSISSPSPTPGSTPPVQTAPSLPRLASGPHLGMITGFDPLNAARSQQAALRYDQARSSGASIGRVQIDWADLEPAQGQYDAQSLADAFADPGLEGMNVVVLLSTLDTEGLTVPDYLGDESGFRDGLTLGSPEVTGAFSAFLDWLGPQLAQRNVWLLSIANEPIGPVEDGVVDEAEAVTFYSAAMDQWNTAVPEIGITATFTLAAPDGIPQFYQAVRERSDIVSFNYYCLTGDILVSRRPDWEARVANMKADAGDREIFIQELGCPVGFSPQSQPTAIGGSLQTQVEFFEYMREVFATDPQFRAATMFQLYDWSPELSVIFSDSLRDAGEDVIADRLEEWLATSGFLRWEDSFERPAWQTWRAALERVRAVRED